MSDRRQFLGTVGSLLGITSISGCFGLVMTDSADPIYPGGTVVIENTAARSLPVSVTAVEDRYEASLETIVPAGETRVRREFVAAEAGDLVTLAARLGDSGGPYPFEFLPAGGENNARPEVARLTIRNAVEPRADWTAERASR
ncbi:hypothetical protein [Halorhabdus sp. SVX81]|uniref:hypothetical protein n=1 Tax=Halorhabdus sp. SVX81 TaxID=2978283 RepID=UPI0023DCAF80|nr:hypothetical protein [Halorhabdus sp. SVX81]